MWLIGVFVLCLISPVPGLSPAQREISAALGSQVLIPMEIELRRDSSRCDEFTWKYRYKNDFKASLLAKSRNCREPTVQRLRISENGSLEIPDAAREDSGIYTVEVHDSGGKLIHSANYTLYIQAPVSDPLLRVSCRPDGSAEISCRVQNGSDPTYSLSVNGRLELDSVSSVSGSGVNITVSSAPPWNISCSVRNRISERNSSLISESCPVPVSDPLLRVSCRADGRAEISCWAQNGSDPTYSLSVNGRLEVDSVSSVSGSGVNITVSSAAPWDISCSARNRISERHSSLISESCPETCAMTCLTKSVLGGCVTLFVTTVPLVVVCLHPMRKPKGNP
ncbi:hepatocyte cell adhesion molecule-like isoform X2 [Spea bombifrons]|uniref:hepatocyte cell adhesion molecule-like isoform X2 n=1 Tax=Spea bombifrons TaxID=233779 RepID=UPI00234962AD|nr:hepatocyte cell adhesion molecule-like isoform X2 [Spea bombifrons]